MKRSGFTALAAIAIASTTLFASHASAQSLEALRVADEVRDDFVRAGLQADAPTTWWANGVTTFTVRGAGRDRIAMVLVYPTLEAAQAERRQPGAHDANGDIVSTRPHLVPGYGSSVWSGNVAVVQSSLSELSRLYIDCAEVVIRVDTAAVDVLAIGADVDTDVIAILDQGLVIDV
jgi:hypothetical protein